MNKLLKMHLLLAVIFLLSCLSSVHAQEGIKYIYLDSPTYEYIDYLINSGKTIPKFIFRQPYELERDLKFSSKHREGQYFQKYWAKIYEKNNASFHLSVSDHVKKDNGYLNRYKAEGGVQYVAAYITLANRTTVDHNYKYNPLFAGDLSESENWLYGRVNDAYMNLNYKNFDVFIGRTRRNWGPLNDYSFILSDNAYSYDHILFNYTTNHIKFSVIYAQLEDVDAYKYAYPDSVIVDSRKYFVGHRLDIRFTDNFQIALTEMATYGGPGRDFEFSFINPMNFYYPIQRNDKKEMDGFWAIDLFYKPLPELTVYGQFLIDDVVVNNDPGVDDRARYPDRLAGMVSLRSGDLILNGLNMDLSYVRVWNRTYQSKFTWQNYHYRGLGLGYPCAGCEEVKLKFAYWGFFPFWFKNESIYGRYGNVALTDLFPLKKEDFPIEPVRNNFINHLDLNYFFSTNFTVHASVTYRENIDHYSNQFGEKDNLIFSLGAKLFLSYGVGID